jgi:hypothetical protein
VCSEQNKKKERVPKKREVDEKMILRGKEV